MTRQILQVTPFMHVADLQRAIDFFVDILGFEMTFGGKATGYAYVQRDGVGVRLMESCADEPPVPGDRSWRYYFDVRDVDALYAELKPKLAGFAEKDVYGPVDQTYGQREFMVLAPDGFVVAFGQRIVR